MQFATLIRRWHLRIDNDLSDQSLLISLYLSKVLRFSLDMLDSIANLARVLLVDASCLFECFQVSSQIAIWLEVFDISQIF